VNRTLRFPLIALGAVLVLAVAANVFAQGGAPPAPRPPQGLFGGARPDQRAKTRVDFTASVTEGHDSDVPTQLGSTIDPSDLQSGGFSTILNANASYAHKGNRLELAANANSVIRRYAELGDTRSLGHGAGVGLTGRVAQKTTLFVNQSAAYTPVYLFGVFPTGVPLEVGDPGSTAPDYTTVSDFDSYAYETTMSLRHDFTRRKSLAVTGEFLYTDRLRESEHWRDVDSHWFSAQYAQNVGPNLALRGGYKYRAGQFGYGGDGRTEEHRVDIGFDYVKPLSATRRMTVNFNLGSSAADIPQSTPLAIVLRREFLAVADGTFAYQFNRTWQARASYRRGLEYVVDLPEPVFADGFGAGVDGFLTRRIDLSGTVGYSSGESLLNKDSLQFDTYTGDVRVRYGLSRSVAVYGEYLYYFYDFASNTHLLAGMPPGLERNGLRAGVTLWMPAVRR